MTARVEDAIGWRIERDHSAPASRRLPAEHGGNATDDAFVSYGINVSGPPVPEGEPSDNSFDRG
jgi:hypothetical protein